jgi:UDP-3-O-[3-hydroxymyristoyl] glucosamine N-acyltransferase
VSDSKRAVIVMTLAELGARLGAQVQGEPWTLISGAAWRLEDAQSGDLVRVEGRRWLSAAEEGPAAALVLGPELHSDRKPALLVAQPALALALALGVFNPRPSRPSGLHPSVVCGEGTEFGDSCTIMPLCVLGARVRLGRGVVLHPHVVLGDDVTVGEDSEIFAQVTLYDHVTVGARTRIHSGAVIGADGFGYVANGSRRQKVPQVGSVIIGDDVEIGANTTIDRATTGVTRIGSGTKIDNQVQIGHNAQIGENCTLVAQVGLAGSVVIEDGVTFGGQAGAKEHVRVGRGSVVAGRGAVFGDLPPGSFVSGYPARPHYEQLKVEAAVQRLPKLQRAVRELERRLRALLGEDGVKGSREETEKE